MEHLFNRVCMPLFYYLLTVLPIVLFVYKLCDLKIKKISEARVRLEWLTVFSRKRRVRGEKHTCYCRSFFILPRNEQNIYILNKNCSIGGNSTTVGRAFIVVIWSRFIYIYLNIGSTIVFSFDKTELYNKK